MILTARNALLYGPLIVHEKYLAPTRSKVIGQLIRDGESGGSSDNSRLAIVVRKLIVNGREYDLETEPLSFLRRSSKRSNVGIGEANVVFPVAYETNTQLTFTLSRPVELPIIRFMNVPSGVKSMGLRSELWATKSRNQASHYRRTST